MPSDPRASRPHMPEYGLDAGDRGGRTAAVVVGGRAARAQPELLALDGSRGRPAARDGGLGGLARRTRCCSAPPSTAARRAISRALAVLRAHDRARRRGGDRGGSGTSASRNPERLARVRAVYDGEVRAAATRRTPRCSRSGPCVVFGFIERAEAFADTATRWSFPGALAEPSRARMPAMDERVPVARFRALPPRASCRRCSRLDAPRSRRTRSRACLRSRSGCATAAAYTYRATRRSRSRSSPATPTRRR